MLRKSILWVTQNTCRYQHTVSKCLLCCCWRCLHRVVELSVLWKSIYFNCHFWCRYEGGQRVKTRYPIATRVLLNLWKHGMHVYHLACTCVFAFIGHSLLWWKMLDCRRSELLTRWHNKLTKMIIQTSFNTNYVVTNVLIAQMMQLMVTNNLPHQCGYIHTYNIIIQ